MLNDYLYLRSHYCPDIAFKSSSFNVTVLVKKYKAANNFFSSGAMTIYENLKQFVHPVINLISLRQGKTM